MSNAPAIAMGEHLAQRASTKLTEALSGLPAPVSTVIHGIVVAQMVHNFVKTLTPETRFEFEKLINGALHDADF